MHVIDTAGLRDAQDEVEKLGVARSWSRIEQADAVVLLHDLTRLGDPSYASADAQILARLPPPLLAGDRLLHVYNKVDAAGSQALPPQGLPLSARTGQGLGPLRQALLRLAGWHEHAEGVFIARARHVQALRKAQVHLASAQALAALADGALDRLAEELRLAHDELGVITGAFSSEALLGEIFSRFCIGK